MEAFRPYSNWRAQLQERSGKKQLIWSRKRPSNCSVGEHSQGLLLLSFLCGCEIQFLKRKEKKVLEARTAISSSQKKNNEGNLWYLTAEKQKQKTWWYEAPYCKVIKITRGQQIPAWYRQFWDSHTSNISTNSRSSEKVNWCTLLFWSGFFPFTYFLNLYPDIN